MLLLNITPVSLINTGETGASTSPVPAAGMFLKTCGSFDWFGNFNNASNVLLLNNLIYLYSESSSVTPSEKTIWIIEIVLACLFFYYFMSNCIDNNYLLVEIL